MPTTPRRECRGDRLACHLPQSGKEQPSAQPQGEALVISNTARLAPTASVALLLASLAAPVPAQAGGTLRIAMTASDVPTTTGAPDNGFEGLRFFGYPVYEGLVLWDLTRADKLAEIRPGLAESWEQDKTDKSKWIFHLRRGVKFHDGSDFNANAVIWTLDRYFKADVPQTDPTGGAFARGRDPWIASYRKIDNDTIEIGNPRPMSYFPGGACVSLFLEPSTNPEDRLVARV